jgi:sugar/nucleoside kinase (ribokinase family)
MRIIVLGEILVEFFPQPFEAALATASQYERYAGGAPLTFAAVVERLGGTSVLVAAVGDDPFSAYLRQALNDEGIGTDRLRTVAGKQVGLVFHDNSRPETAFVFYREVAAGTELNPDDVDRALIEGADIVYFPGTTLQISQSARDACLKAAHLAKEAGVPLIVDPNLRLLHSSFEDRQCLEKVMRMAAIVTPNLQEAQALTGVAEPVEMGEKLLALGPRTVAVTLADKGCYLWHKGEIVHAPGHTVETVEPTGAGDAFAAALCIGVWRDWPAAKIADYANAAGALAVKAVGHLGAALPTREAMEALCTK